MPLSVGCAVDGVAAQLVAAVVDHGGASRARSVPSAAAPRAPDRRSGRVTRSVRRRSASTSTRLRRAIRSPSHCCSAPCTSELRGRGELGAVRREDELQQAAAEVGPLHALARRGEQHLLDQVADVRVVVGLRGAAAAVELVGKAQVHRRPQLPITRGLRRRPAAAACRSARRSPGCPSAPPAGRSTSTRSRRDHPLRRSRTAPVPPATSNGAARDRVRRGHRRDRLAARPARAGWARVGIACPPCAQSTVAPRWRRGPGIAAHYTTVSAPLLTVTVGPISVIDRALAVLDVDAGVVDDERRAGRALQHDAAGRARARR